MSELTDSAQALLNATDDERIHSIRQGSWLGYARANEIMQRMEDLLNYPKVTRMPNMLLVAPSFNGKTSILERFMQKHPPNVDPARVFLHCPVVMVEAPPTPDVSAFYTRILEKLMAPFRPQSPPQMKYSQIKALFAKLEVQMLVVDEIHHLIAGGLNRQRDFRNALKSLGNETKVPIVAAGIEDAYNAFNTDPQMSSRFTPEELPLWKTDANLAAVLQALERRTPLKKPSNLTEPRKLLEIHTKSEGTLGDICDLFKELAVDAIRTGKEEITLQRIQSIRWVPPSKRRKYTRF